MHTPRRFPYRKKILTPPQAPGSFCFSLVCCCLFAAALLAGCRKAGGFVLFFEIPDLWDGTVAAGFAGGSGSAADPYRI
ncbi:MAG: hypothetical protein LBI86_03680, partial [Treponema sp.]|nr:hypothetical protein [Treponema sp.]